MPLPDEVGLRLAAHIAEYPPASVTLPWQAPGGRPVTAELVFTSRESRAIDRNSWNRYAWQVALGKAGAAAGREAGFHQLRHHFASTALFAGCDIRSLADWLGHADPAFTLRVYSHMMPAAPDKLRQAIDASYLWPMARERRRRQETPDDLRRPQYRAFCGRLEGLA